MEPQNPDTRSWSPTNLDLLLSVILAAGFPVLASVLYNATGALIPMIIYYAVAWGVVKWRRGQTGYLNRPKKKLPVSFVVNTALVIVTLMFAAAARVQNPAPDASGIVLSAIFWPILNGASEQLLWIYIFESWDLRFPWKTAVGTTGKGNISKNWTFRVIGLLLNSTFVGMIHVMFWAKFLTTVDPKVTLGVLFVVMSTFTGFGHLWVWRESNQMVFTFIPHYILNLLPFFWTGYSLVPFLFHL